MASSRSACRHQIGRQCNQTRVPAVPEQDEIQSLIGRGKRREWIFAMQRPGKAFQMAITVYC